jgi:hypothetical protein
MKLFSNRKRPVHLGPFPLERLHRVDRPVTAVVGPARTTLPPSASSGLSGAVQAYLDAFLARNAGRKMKMVNKSSHSRPCLTEA